jgi:cytochrome c
MKWLYIIGVLALAILGAGIAMASRNRDIARRQAEAIGEGDVERGRLALVQYGCGACHTIPGVRQARGLVGPPLTNFASRVYIAGRLPNTPDNLVTWIRHPQQVTSGTAMPETGIGDAEAHDVVSYLYTLR